jgi:hypothetical protein
MRRVAAIVLAGALAALASPAASGAEPSGADPDWPCQQALVPTLSAGMVWSGPSPDGFGDWHGEPAVAALVQRIAPREVPTADGEAAIQQFTHDVEGDRKRLITLAFAGLLDETNRQRSEVIQRIKLLAERQRNLASLVARLTTELDQTPAPADSASPEAAQRTDLLQRWTFTSRAYNELQRTMRYACEVPSQLDARLGVYARALEAGLS